VTLAALASLVLHILLALYVIQALLKMAVHFFVPYQTRRKRIDAIYAGRQIALYDDIVLLLMLVFVGLLVVAGSPAYLSFITGLVVGMTLIQVYFHRFSAPLPPQQMPAPPMTPIKLMSYAIQASPRRAWREYVIMTWLLLWALYALVTSTFGLFD
jgi:hypothetical protein